VHAGQGGRFGVGELGDEIVGVLGVGVVIHGASHGLTRPQDVSLGEWWVVGTRLSEEIAAEEGGCRVLEQISAIPSVG
jgi:hypothetical protein